MHRRAFIPWSDRLETRTLLSGGVAPGVVRRPAQVAPLVRSEPLSSLETRLQRIERLPAFLDAIAPGRPLPAEAIRTIQQDLILLIGRLNPAPRAGLQAFNEALRGMISSASVSEAQLLQLEHLFGSNLTAAGAHPTLVASLAGAVRTLAQADVNVPNPGAVVANDYGLVLQLALGMGKPLPGPVPPRLTRASNTGRLNDNITTVTQPTFEGSYAASGSTMQLINREGTAVFGEGLIGADGRYRITVNRALEPGRYQFRVRAVTPDGLVSLPSRPLTVHIVTGRGPAR
ncbi:MAG: hypothetical protein KatS3mg108_1286 [Isosphaeraceae bacterium]|jgi:hypothetical protein|nr:MAG: hypothetical protein KatS3mg108_1286 [Isosphaeraceae bacterium]